MLTLEEIEEIEQRALSARETAFATLVKENEQLKFEVARLRQELVLLQKLGRESTPPF